MLGFLTLTAWGAKHDKGEAPPPTLRIPTDPLGYHPLSSFYLMGRTSSVSLDFVDDDHLLFTFRVPVLLKRLVECGPEDEDQLIRAMVIHLPDGKVERSAEWRMHDRGRYLWALRDGKFLVRQRDQLFTTDSSLNLHPYIESKSPIRLVKLSPDARLLLIETDLEKHTEEEHRRLVEEARQAGLSMPREDVQLSVIQVDNHTAVGHARAYNPTDLPLIADGYLETLSAKGDHWMVRYKPFQGEPSVVAEVASSCHPNESSLNGQTLFLSTCSGGGSDHVFQAISLTGKRLWSYRWDSHFIWPTTAYSENGQRIAFSTLRVARPVSAMDPFDETELQGQRIEVLDVETGKLAMSQFATPMLSGGQNYGLSADGRRFVILRENAIEVYDLPAVTTALAAVN
ncbi:hypothetical protein ACPOL_0244 [Acidisarcina polymorpha]|uniref:Uncharacterized protein n=1 Tax=Acidisarcina polymorpha TaxID=2211140 RepID=A0A2Z5FS82_9BACT|nr:hypothetical protein ACPOL_0244 [Acidisarcina polymorpha]